MIQGIQNLLFFLLGAVGLVAIGLMPYRSWIMVQSSLAMGMKRSVHKALLILTLAVVVLVIVIDMNISIRIYRCLSEKYCGPNVASGWIYLSWLGIVYLVFEIFGYLIRKVRAALHMVGDVSESQS